GTLREVGLAWARPDQRAAVERFSGAQALRQAAHHAGFDVTLDSVTERFHYPDLAAVTASIKGIGAQLARDGARLTRADIA
ncbi:hypothetical protein, partial [Staphylococcus epidermidis]|uniref:hypothetical protein n=1 Tax=Staphylococcus epidermidis TaxID=1282 RepID=UPI0030BF098B